MLLFYMIMACLIGVTFAAQPGINGAAARSLGSVFPATVLSVGITLVASSLIMIFGRTTPSASEISTLPIWVGLGGLIGVLVVAGGAYIVPITGAAVFFVCFVSGQLFGSVLLDQSGAFGMDVREISISRIFGVLLAFAGVFFVRYG